MPRALAGGPRRHRISPQYERVARRLLNDPLGDRTEHRPGDEVAASPPEDQEVGAHVTGTIDQHHGRIPAAARVSIVARRPAADQPVERRGVRVAASTSAAPIAAGAG